MTNGRDIEELLESGLTRLTLGLAECRNAGMTIPVALFMGLSKYEERYPDISDMDKEEIAVLCAMIDDLVYTN